MSPELAAAIGAAIAAEDGSFAIRDLRAVAGGGIARKLCVADGRRRYFVKLQSPDRARLAAEAAGLAALARCPALVVPRVVATGVADRAGFLVLEWLELEKSGDEGWGGEVSGGRSARDSRLAEAIAALHAIEYPRYGWDGDNWIGATPQPNAWCGDWAEFFVSRRLQPQIRLALAAGHGRLGGDARRFCHDADRFRHDADRLGDAVRAGLAGYRPRASLLHGDLWSGNVGFVGGRPALFDPAVYAGDGETDLAMAALFGGVSRRFFERYQELCPAGEGFAWRRALYQLYHVLNHLNLFGASYLGQAQALMACVIEDHPSG